MFPEEMPFDSLEAQPVEELVVECKPALEQVELKEDKKSRILPFADEMCQCGHAKSEHFLASYPGGDCKMCCACKKFETEPIPIKLGEKIADRFAEKISPFTSACKRKVQWLKSRTSEVFEDFWTEVQDFRRGEKKI